MRLLNAANKPYNLLNLWTKFHHSLFAKLSHIFGTTLNKLWLLIFHFNIETTVKESITHKILCYRKYNLKYFNLMHEIQFICKKYSSAMFESFSGSYFRRSWCRALRAIFLLFLAIFLSFWSPSSTIFSDAQQIRFCEQWAERKCQRQWLSRTK